MNDSRKPEPLVRMTIATKETVAEIPGLEVGLVAVRTGRTFEDSSVNPSMHGAFLLAHFCERSWSASRPRKTPSNMQPLESSSTDLLWHDRVHDQCREVQVQLTDVLAKIHRPASRSHRIRLSIFNEEDLQIAMACQIHTVLQQG